MHKKWSEPAMLLYVTDGIKETLYMLEFWVIAVFRVNHSTWNLSETYPIFHRALDDIKIITMHQNKSTSMGNDHAKGF